MRIDDEQRRKVLITPAELHEICAAGPRPHILAVQSVNPYTGANSRDGSWIAGAVDVDAYEDLQDPPSDARGQRPLPDPKRLEQRARAWGLTHDSMIVVYDNDRAMTAARGWWVLKWAGFRDVRVLDGGLPAWRRAGLPLENNPNIPAPSDIVTASGHMPELTAETALALTQSGVLLDARIRPNYIGGPVEGGDPRRGHIPGAISAPTLDTLTDPGPFTDSATLRELFSGLGVGADRPVGVYCGAGMSAAHTVLALAAIGVEAAMYPGSWSQWIDDPTRPVRRGPLP